MSTENLVTGKYYRILKDKVNHIYDRISFWTHSDDVETSSGATLTSDLSAKDTKISSTQSDFGSVETSSVSSHAYVKGNLLLYNNQLYRAKTAIAVGATLTVGSNIEAVTVGTLSNMLTASNGNQFNFDVKDGTPGFYPSASKTSSEFVPFGGTGLLESLIPEGKCLLTYPSGSFSWSNIPSQGVAVSSYLNDHYTTYVIKTKDTYSYKLRNHNCTVQAIKDGTRTLLSDMNGSDYIVVDYSAYDFVLISGKVNKGSHFILD